MKQNNEVWKEGAEHSQLCGLEGVLSGIFSMCMSECYDGLVTGPGCISGSNPLTAGIDGKIFSSL